MRKLLDFFSTEPPQPLHHYTGVSSLIGMADKRHLWASNAFFLNDSTEITHASEVIKSVISEDSKSLCKTDKELEFLKQLSSWLPSPGSVPYNIFIFSLSEEKSLLSQWRSYTPHGKGISLEFPPSAIKAIAGKSNLKIARCLYEEAEQHELVSTLLKRFLELYREQPEDDLTNTLPQAIKYYQFLESHRGEVLQVLSIIKHKSFQEEREWRLISQYFPNYTVQNIKFREGASLLIPYIEVSLDIGIPWLTSVTLGPSQHANLSMESLRMFLNNRGICNTTENCCIPYRKWN